jgi:pimeloyl-ACP methyl ester carboxylesterase
VNSSYSTAVDRREGVLSLKFISIAGLRTRRAALAAASVAAAFAIPLAFVPASGAATSVAAGPRPGPRPTIVLEHGAFADGSSWDAVVSRLQQDGYTVDVPPNPLEGLYYDSATLRDFLDTISGPVILVGHSYGGSVITNAATGDPNVKALVYVDALAPARGQTMAQLLGAVPGSCAVSANLILVPYPGAPAGAEDAYLKPSVFGSCLANGLPASEASALAATQRPTRISLRSTRPTCL